VLMYAHHDVQAHGRGRRLGQRPFEREQGRGDRLYGARTADDKAGVAVLHLARCGARGTAPGGVTVLVSRAEERSARTACPAPGRFREALRADVVVFADAGHGPRTSRR